MQYANKYLKINWFFVIDNLSLKCLRLLKCILNNRDKRNLAYFFFSSFSDEFLKDLRVEYCRYSKLPTTLTDLYSTH